MNNVTTAQKACRDVFATLDEAVRLECVKTLIDIQVLKEPDWLLDALCQHYHHGYDIYDAFCLLRFRQEIGNGNILAFQVGVNAFPSKDKEVDEQNAKLRTLPPPFYGTFLGECLDVDGTFGWTQPVSATNLLTREQITLPPSEVGLEVGTFCPSKLRYFFYASLLPSALARWPYGSQNITVLWNTDTKQYLEDDCIEIAA